MSRSRLVYIEASTGRRWDLPALGERLSRPGLEVEFRPIYGFDKSAAVQALCEEGAEALALVFLQECSVYFPGDRSAYQWAYAGWIDQLLAAGWKPVVVTTVPPAANMGAWQNLKNFVKARLLRRESQYEQVVAFNQWLRSLASQRQLPLLDLERVLRLSDHDRHLSPRFDSGDGIHVNAAAYAVLDSTMGEFLDRLLPGR